MNYIIYQTAFIGDIILATSMVKTIKDVDTHANIFFITTPVGKEILLNNDYIDEVIVYDKKTEDKGISGIIKITKKLRRCISGNDSIFVSPHRFTRASILGLLSGSKMRIGFSNSSLSFFYNRVVPYRFGIHEVERNFELLRAVFNDIGNRSPDRPKLFPADEDYSKVREMIYSQTGTDRSIVSIAPGSIWFTKRWPLELFCKLIELLRNNGVYIVLIGGKDDMEICESLSGNCVVNLAGRLSILESAAAISLSKAIVTNDSAPLHIASAMNIPTIAIFGATTPSLGFAPLADNSIIIEKKDIVCRPCGRHGSMKCRKKSFECMYKIYPEMVFNEIIKVL